jgi:hypothetical protein
MSTRSRIGIEDQETGKVRSIYCHFDGYLEGVGRTLVDHYKDREKVEALIALGDLSALDDEVAPPPGVHHKYGEVAPGVTVAYCRDRGETNVGAAEDESADAMVERATKGWEEFAYLYRQGVWFVREIGGGAGPFLVNANDPEGEQEKPWANVEGALRFGMNDHRAYGVIGGRMGSETETARIIK